LMNQTFRRLPAQFSNLVVADVVFRLIDALAVRTCQVTPTVSQPISTAGQPAARKPRQILLQRLLTGFERLRDAFNVGNISDDADGPTNVALPNEQSSNQPR
jgi:hypothetical protein